MKTKSIWKYQLLIKNTQKIEMPKNSEILCVQVQHNIPCIWVMVNLEEQSREFRTFIMHGTGHQFKNNGYTYIGTYQIEEGLLIFHLFEKI